MQQAAAIFLSGAFLFFCDWANAQNYLTDLGAVAPTLAINNSGQVVLQSYLYSNGTLAPLPAGMCGVAINNNGDVAGVYVQGATTCGGLGVIALYGGGVLTQYSASGGVGGINDSGTIVGFDGGPDANSEILIMNGAVSYPADCNNVGEGQQYWAVNNAGEIVVNWDNPAVNLDQIYPPTSVGIFSQGTCTNIGFGWGNAINANGAVAGYQLNIVPNTQNQLGNTFVQYGAVFATGGTPSAGNLLLNTLDLYGINASGFAVGYGNAVLNPSSEGTPSGSYHAFIYNGGTPATDLNDFVLSTDPLKSYVTLQQARGINDSGLVVANGVDSRTNVQHAYLLQVPLVWVSPSQSLFAITPVGSTSAPQTLTFTNYGAASVTLGGVSASAQFSVQNTTCGASLPPSATCSASVVYVPTTVVAPGGNVTLIAAGVPINAPVSSSAPLVAIQASPNPVLAGTPFTVTWESTPGSACEVNGSMLPPAPPGWSDPLPSSGSKTFTSSIGPNEFIFGITCSANGGSQSAFVTVNVHPTVGTVNLTASPTTVYSGQPITLTWTSQNQTQGCLGSGGGPSDGWNGAQLPANGSRAITEPLNVVTGQSEKLTFSISCYSASGSGANASVKVVQLDSPAPASHGGGAFDWLFEMFLFGMLGFQSHRRASRRTLLH
jgi:hypothetical protein